MKDENYLNGIEYEMDIGYFQSKDHVEDKNQLYHCGDGLLVRVNLPYYSHVNLQYNCDFINLTGGF